MRSRLADYQLLGPAGPGNRAWVARPPARLGRSSGDVVVVELPDGDWSYMRPALTELAGVSSPHLPALIEAGRTTDESGTINWAAREDGRPRPDTLTTADPRSTLRLLAGAARGAHDLHEAGWYHGAISPATVLAVGDKGLLDLPLHQLGPRRPPASPAELDPVDPASVWGEGPSRATDIWSLGATANRMLSGQLVHPSLPGDALVTAVQRVLMEGPRIAPTLPEPVAATIHSCLSSDPADRPQTAAALADRFEELADEPMGIHPR